MMRTQIWTTAFALLAGGALAAPSIDAPLPEPRLERTASWDGWTQFEDGALAESVQPFGSVFPEEGIQIAQRSRSKEGSDRGGGRSKKRGGFSKGNERSAARGGGSARSSRSGERGGSAGASRSGERGGGASDSRSGERGGGASDSRSGERGGDRSGDRKVDADDLDDAHMSDKEKVGAALVGGVVGRGVGKMINNSEDPGN